MELTDPRTDWILRAFEEIGIVLYHRDFVMIGEDWTIDGMDPSDWIDAQGME